MRVSPIAILIPPLTDRGDSITVREAFGTTLKPHFTLGLDWQAGACCVKHGREERVLFREHPPRGVFDLPREGHAAMGAAALVAGFLEELPEASEAGTERRSRR
jgi:hypothetical protein